MRLVSRPSRRDRNSAPFHPCRPHHQLRRQDAAIGQANTVGKHFGHLGLGVHLDTQLAQQALGRLRQALGQRRQHARRGLDQGEPDVLVGVDAVQPVGHHLARGVVQLGGKLDTGGARTDDRHVQLLRPQRRALGVGAHAGIDHAHVEAARVGHRLELERVLAHAGRTEVVALAADRHHQGVVGKRARRRDLRAVLIHEGGDMDLARAAVEPGHAPDAEAEAMPVRLRQVGHLVIADVHAAGRDLVQLGLPDVRALAVDQGDFGRAAAAELAAQSGGQFEATGTTADDHDAVRPSIHALGHCIQLPRLVINLENISRPVVMSSSWVA